MRRRILVDLSHAADGYVGIAHDIRTIFAMLAGLPDLDAAGLLMPTGRHDLPRFHAHADHDPALASAALHWMTRNWSDRDYPRPLGMSLRRPIEALAALRSRHWLMPLDTPARSSAAWRVLFGRTLPAEARSALMQCDYLATDLSVLRIIDRTTYLPMLPPKYLDAGGFKAVLFSMPRPVRLPPGVRPLIRFHDAVPVTRSGYRQQLAHPRRPPAPCARLPPRCLVHLQFAAESR
jgi:hypothetical protein